jgi:HK97 family phage major capsid protein
MRKKTLEKRLQRLNDKIQALRSKALASEDASEVRSINEQIADINEDIADIKEELEAINAEERAAEVETEKRSLPPIDAKTVNGSVIESMSVQKREANVDSTEYRNAFKAYVQRGVTIPAEYRNGDATNTANAGAVIPVTIMNEVINTVRKRYGNLYAKVRKTSVKGGVEYPIGALRGQVKWINESTVSPRQKAGDVGSVIFKYNVGEIRVAQTFLSEILSLTDFENKLTEIIAIAYLQAMDEAIVNGSGEGSPLGILNDARVTNTVTLTEAEFSDWTKWRKKFFASLPLGYRAGEFIFPVSTVDAYLETMADSNNNPIFRQATGLEVNDGDAMNPNGRFFGHNISLVEPDIIADFSTASSGDVVGIFWQPEEYAINENFGFTMRRYFDEETNEWVDKAIFVADGKVLNPTGFYKILKG